MTNPSFHKPSKPTGNRTIAVVCVCMVVGMVGLAYASVPLYNLFCRVTGYGGTTSVAEVFSDEILDREMIIRFDASRAARMPWRFVPKQRSQRLRVGETGLALYQAENKTNRTVTGTATYNVTPQKAGLYFAKVECFCFTEQTLAPGETVDMPVSYFVDPAIADDPNLDDVETITLSYTFFEVASPEGDYKKLSLNQQ